MWYVDTSTKMPMYTPHLRKIAGYWPVFCTWILQKASHLSTKKWTHQELALLFALACVLGMASKTIAINTLTIGYEDYLIKSNPSTELYASEVIIPKGPLCEE